MKKNIFIILFLLLFAYTMTTAQSISAEQPPGSGTTNDPYRISTLNHLLWLSEPTPPYNISIRWGANYIQTADIDASATSGWNSGEGISPIGDSNNSFTGTYDGNGYTISGLIINRSLVTYTGFFGRVASIATIKNLGITGPGSITSTGTTYTGGLAGRNEGIIDSCYATIDVSGSGSTGGLVGENTGTISNSYATGNVSGAANYIGGLVGQNANTAALIEYCYATGDVDVYDKGGGLVGRNYYAQVHSSYAMGNVHSGGSAVSYSSYTRLGGFVGELNSNDNNQYAINCYSTGQVNYGNFTQYSGGFAGQYGGSLDNIYNCFWDTDSSKLTSSHGGTGKTTTEMKTKSTFTNASWDFTTPVWHIDENLNDGYPYLDWQLFTNEILDITNIGSSSVYILDGVDIGLQAESGTVDVEFELKDTTPPDFPSGTPYVGVYWDITSVSGGNVKLRLYYYPEDISDFSGAPKIFHYNGSDWVELPTTGEMVDGDRRYVETTNYYGSYSPVTIGDDANPLPVELVSFKGSASEDGVMLNWETATEVNNYGYEIERQNSETGTQNAEWEKVGFVQGSGTANSSHSYSFVDSDLPSTTNVDYRLKQIDNDGSSTYSKTIEVDISTITDVKNGVKYDFALKQNYPNPFNPTTIIKYSIAKENKVELKIYNILGEEVETLVNETEAPGNYKVEFNGSKLASGIYFDRLKSGNHVSIKKLMLVK